MDIQIMNTRIWSPSFIESNAYYEGTLNSMFAQFLLQNSGAQHL